MQNLNEPLTLLLAGALALAQFVLPVVLLCAGLRLWSRLRRKAEAAAAARQGDGEPLADRLCRLRLARGLSQEEAAAAAAQACFADICCRGYGQENSRTYFSPPRVRLCRPR